VLGSDFDAVAECLVPAVMRLLAQSKRIAISMGASCLSKIIEKTTFNYRVFERIIVGVSDKNSNMREHCLTLARLAVMKALESSSSLAYFQRVGGVEAIERCLFKSLGDAAFAVREKSRLLYQLYQQQWPDRVDRFLRASMRLNRFIHSFHLTLDVSVRKALGRSQSAASFPRVRSAQCDPVVDSRKIACVNVDLL
jgi:hypothetical protein